MIRKTSLFLILAISNSYFSLAQKVEFGGGGGPTFYKGDLHPVFGLMSPGIGGNVFLRYNFNKVLSAKANFMMGTVNGNDSRTGNPFLKERDFSFTNRLADYALQIEYNFLNFRTHTGRYEHDWTPYLFAGYGRTHILDKKIARGNTSAFPAYDKGSTSIIPYGIGIKKILAPKLNLSVEFSTRVFLNRKNGSLFDGLDGVDNSNLNNSNQYYASGLISAGDPSFDYLSNANTKQKDKYFHLSVTLSYLIYRIHCDKPNKKFFLF